MPVLPSQPNLYPEQLFGEEDSPPSGMRAWWVFHTRPRQEKSLARTLHNRQVPYYLPIIARRFRIRGRPMTSYLPLFPGYLFVLANPEERWAALNSPQVARTLEVNDQQMLWQDLRQVHQLIATGAPVMPEERLGVGSRVVVETGPLAGLQGVILSTAKGRRFVVQVNFMQRGASVLLDDFDLRPAEEG